MSFTFPPPPPSPGLGSRCECGVGVIRGGGERGRGRTRRGKLPSLRLPQRREQWPRAPWGQCPAEQSCLGCRTRPPPPRPPRAPAPRSPGARTPRSPGAVGKRVAGAAGDTEGKGRGWGGEDTPNLAKSVPTPLRGVRTVPSRLRGVPVVSGASPPLPSRFFPRTPAGSARPGAQQVGIGQRPQVRSAPLPPQRRLPFSHPSNSSPSAPLIPPRPPSPHYSCYPKAASVPKRRHVRGKQSAIVPSLGTRGGGAGAAARRPPPGPRSDAIVMEIGLFPACC